MRNPKEELNSQTFKQGRYLLLLDILGFTELIQHKAPAEIYSVIDDALQAFGRWEQLNAQFKTLYFSDTFVFYQEPRGYGDWAFLDVYAIGAMVLSALLARGIPARGSITFGEFEVKADSSARHQVYFGNALIEAYQTERKENWIGITIQKSAWEPYEQNNNGIVASFEAEGVWRKRNDGVLMLYPFIKLRAWYAEDLIGEIEKPYMEWDQPEFPNDILGFKFLRDKDKQYKAAGDFFSREAMKYHSTLAFLESVMGREMFEWAIKIGELSR
jgi:hypothetical protein